MRKLFFLFFILISVFSCATVQRAGTGRSKIKDSLTAEITGICRLQKFNGFSVAIVNESGILYENGFGLSNIISHKRYTAKTIQNIASVSKTLVGIALLKARELGKLNLDDPIQLYLPFRVINPAFPQEPITIRQLATHTSSITDNEFYLSKNYYLKPGQSLGSATIYINDAQLFFNSPDSIIPMSAFLEKVTAENGEWNHNSFSAHKPGTIYEYSNTGTALAAFIIERATGQSFKAFTEQYIIEPLKMNHSGWQFNDVNLKRNSRLYAHPNSILPFYELITYPDGGFITSAHDLGKFLAELIRGYNGKGIILSQESFQEYFKPQLTASNFNDRNERNPYSESYNTGIFIGFGYTGYTGYIGHTGGDPGVLSMMFFDPRTNIGRILITNTSFSDKAGNDAFYGIWNTLEKYQSGLLK